MLYMIGFHPMDIYSKTLLSNLGSVVDWKVVTAANQRQVDIDNVRENAKRVTFDYAIGNRVYVEMTGIYRKLDYRKQGLYIITEVFKNGTAWVQHVQVNELINIRRLKPHFDE